jgi:hypothetical protein
MRGFPAPRSATRTYLAERADLLHERHANGAGVYQQLQSLALGGARGSKRHLAKRGERRQRDEHHLALIGEVLGRSGAACLAFEQRLHRCLVDVVHGQTVPAIEQLVRHGLPHVADTQIPRFHRRSPADQCLVIRSCHRLRRVARRGFAGEMIGVLQRPREGSWWITCWTNTRTAAISGSNSTARSG